jgi:PAS domain S-box-containing protein
MPAILWTTDYQLLITSMRGAGLAALGLEHDSLVGTTLFDFFGSTDPEHPELAPYFAARRGDSVSYETDIAGRTLGVHLEPLRDAAGAIVGTIGIALDISERKQAEVRLREKEEQYRSIFEATSDGLMIRNLDGNIVEVNPAYGAMHGYTRDELIGQPLTTLIHPDYHYVLKESVGAISARGDDYRIEAVNMRKDGTPLFVEVRGTSFTYKGEPHVLAIVRDITERRQAEEQLREKEAQYRSIFEATGDGLIIRNLEGIIVEANPAYCRMHGYTQDEMVGRHITEFLAADASPSLGATGAISTTGDTFHKLRKDGTLLYVEARGTAFTYKGQPHILAVVRDITERKEAEAQLREKEEQYRSIFEATMDGLVITDLRTGRLIAVNPAFAQMHGYTVEELLKLHPTQFIHPDDHSKFFKYIETVGAGETFRTEAMDVRKDGTFFPVEVHGSSYAYGGERHVLGVVRDITERVKAYELLEQRVQERTRELSTLLEVSQNVASTLELKPLLDLILDQLRAVADYNRASLAILDGEEMVIAAYQGRFAAQEVVGERLSVEKLGLIWDRFQAGEYVLIDDIHGDSPPARAVQDYIGSDNVRRIQDVCSSVLVPLVSRERVIGYLNVAHRQTGYYTDHQARLVLAIANQVAGAIENARLYEEAQEETRKAAALAQVASSVALGGTLETALDEVARTVVEASGAVACSMIIAEGDQSRIGIFGAYGMPDGYAAGLEAIVRNGNKIMTVERYYEPEPLVVHGLRQAVLAQPTHAPIHRFMSQVAWDTMVSLPIVYQERHLGRLNLYYPPDKEPDQEELAFLSAIVSQAATAIENARLYAQAQTAAATQERQRLARELHDSVSQALYGIGLGTYAAKNLFERNQSGVAEALDYVTSLAAAGLAEMRALIFELRPESLEIEGLVAALGKQASALAARHRIEVETELPGEPDLPIETKEVLYRVAQEAMHNTVKHAEAQRVHLRLDYSDTAVVLDLSDDGKGFDPSGSFPGHLGLHSMRERVTQLGGTFEIESAPGVGTAIHIHIPI